MLSNFWSSLWSTPNASDDVDSGGTIFSYAILGLVALLLIAIVFGELETA